MKYENHIGSAKISFDKDGCPTIENIKDCQILMSILHQNCHLFLHSGVIDFNNIIDTVIKIQTKAVHYSESTSFDDKLQFIKKHSPEGGGELLNMLPEDFLKHAVEGFYKDICNDVADMAVCISGQIKNELAEKKGIQNILKECNIKDSK